MIVPTSGEFGTGFGFEVAVDGDLLAIGAPADDTVGARAGAVYIYNRDRGGPGAEEDWALWKKLTAPMPQAPDSFGGDSASQP